MRLNSKNYIILIITLSLSISFISPVLASNQEINIVINGQFMRFEVPPINVDGRILVPLRSTFEALGLDVVWNNETQTVLGKKKKDTIELKIGRKYAVKNGVHIELDVPASIINGRTLVPARFIAETIGCRVLWENKSNTVIIFSISNSEQTDEVINYDNGHKYVGNTEKNTPNGFGTSYNNKNDIVYSGYWNYGVYLGKGVAIYPNKGIYAGNFRSGKKSGIGVYKYKNGDSYCGNWINDKKNGKGIYEYSNGNVYDGEFKNDIKEGEGIFSYSDGDKYDGMFRNDKKNGRGIYLWNDSDKYEGLWANDKMDGQGIYHFNDGEKYFGNFENGLFNGYGEYLKKDGTTIKGQWKDNEFKG